MRALLFTIGTNISNIILSLGSGILAARVLQPDGRGVLAEIVFWGTTVAAISSMSVPMALAMEVARNPKDETLLGSGLALAATQSVLAVVLFYLAGPFLVEPKLFFWCMLFAALSIPATFMALTVLSGNHGKKEFGTFNIMRMVPPFVYFASMIGLAVTGSVSPQALALANAGGSIAVCVLKFPELVRLSGRQISRQKIRALLQLGVTLHASHIFSILLLKVDQIWLIYFFDHSALGNYAVAMTASGAGIGAIAGGVLTYYVPHLSGAVEPATQRLYVRLLLGTTLFISIAFAAAMALAAPLLIPLIFGKAYTAASSICIVLCAAQIPIAYASAAALALRTLGEWRLPVIASVSGLISFVALAGPFSVIAGVNGVAFAITAAWSVTMLLLVRRLRKILAISSAECLLPPVGDVKRQIQSLFTKQAREGGQLPQTAAGE